MSDYHLHLHPHRQVPGSPPPGTYPSGYIDRYVDVALSRGVTEIGFTEHLYRCVESEPVLGQWWKRDRSPLLVQEMDAIMAAEVNLSLDRYVEVVLDAKARGLPVKLGLEVDFEPGTEGAVLQLLSGYPFDYLVGSVHWIGAWDFVRASAPQEFARRGVRRAYEEYFELETALAGSGMVNVLAHVDVIKRSGSRPQGGLVELYQPVVEAAVRSGTAVEISSGGLRREIREIFPAPEFLAMFQAAGVPITLASDAHVADDAAWGHAEVVGAARGAGYTEYLRFEAGRRLPTLLPGPEPAATARRSPSAPRRGAR